MVSRALCMLRNFQEMLKILVAIPLCYEVLTLHNAILGPACNAVAQMVRVAAEKINQVDAL